MSGPRLVVTLRDGSVLRCELLKFARWEHPKGPSTTTIELHPHRCVVCGHSNAMREVKPEDIATVTSGLQVVVE